MNGVRRAMKERGARSVEVCATVVAVEVNGVIVVACQQKQRPQGSPMSTYRTWSPACTVTQQRWL